MTLHQHLDRAQLERRYRRSRTWNLVLAAFAAVLLVVLAVQWFDGERNSGGAEASRRGSADEVAPDRTASEDAEEADTAQDADTQCPVADRRDADDPRALGDADAPVVLHEWTDFRCPYCGAFARDTLPALIEEYVETGEVRIEMHDAALVGGDNSVLIAAAARAAGAQGRYFEFFDAIYGTAEERGKAELSEDQLVEFARGAGVADLERFTEDLRGEELAGAVREETANAQSIGVTGVPFFTTSGCDEVLSGAQPLETFRASLDAAIQEAAES